MQPPERCTHIAENDPLVSAESPVLYCPKHPSKILLITLYISA